MELFEKITAIKSLASYCFSCNACDTVCPTHYLGIFDPRTFITNLMATKPEDLHKFISDANLFNCLTCMQCTIHCPMTTEAQGIQFTEIIQQLRAYGVAHGLIDKDLNQTKTHDSMMLLVPKIQAENFKSLNKVSFLTSNPELKIVSTGEIAYFVGCAETLQNIFYNYEVPYTESPQNAIKILNRIGITPVVLPLKCCGHDAYWSGDETTAKKLAEYNVAQFQQAGVKTVIVECAEGFRMWKFDYPKLVPGCNFDVKHLSEYLIESKGIEKIQLESPTKIKVTYHDPCRLGRLGGGVYAAPRDILKRIKNIELVEMENIQTEAQCCGVSCFRACNGITRRLREVRIQEAIKTGAEYLVTTCPKCMTHFKCVLTETDDQGKPQSQPVPIKIIDLAALIGKSIH